MKHSPYLVRPAARVDLMEVDSADTSLAPGGKGEVKKENVAIQKRLGELQELHGDLKERKLWAEYRRAYEDALSKTSTEHAPWYIVPADQKWYRNFIVGSVVAQALEELKLKYPKPKLSDVTVE
jgi:polyphosphate kinase 2 PPK2